MNAADKMRVALVALARHASSYNVKIPPRLLAFWEHGQATDTSGMCLAAGFADVPGIRDRSCRLIAAVPSWEVQTRIGLDAGIVGVNGDWRAAANTLPLFHFGDGRYFVARLDDPKCPVGAFDEDHWQDEGGGYTEGVFVMARSLDAFVGALTEQAQVDVEADLARIEASWDAAAGAFSVTQVPRTPAPVPVHPVQPAQWAPGAPGTPGTPGRAAITERMHAFKIPDDALAAVIGERPTTRPDAVRKVMEYAMAHNLESKRRVRCDATLAPIFEGRDEVDMFELTELVSRHLR